MERKPIKRQSTSIVGCEQSHGRSSEMTMLPSSLTRVLYQAQRAKKKEKKKKERKKILFPITLVPHRVKGKVKDREGWKQ